MTCPKCAANMVQRYKPDIVLLTNPPKRLLQWWCRCGYDETITSEEIPGYGYKKPSWEREWEKINPIFQENN